MATKITVTSQTNLGHQIVKDSLTPTEKKVIIYMINNQMQQGQVRNKVFTINNTSENTANVIIGTTTKSIILGRNETVNQRVSIKF